MNKQHTLDILYRVLVYIWCGRTSMGIDEQGDTRNMHF